jgi:hypothetical protein
VFARSSTSFGEFQAQGVLCSDDLPDLFNDEATIRTMMLLAIPQAQLRAFAERASSYKLKNGMIISVVAGVPLQKLEQLFPRSYVARTSIQLKDVSDSKVKNSITTTEISARHFAANDNFTVAMSTLIRFMLCHGLTLEQVRESQVLY